MEKKSYELKFLARKWELNVVCKACWRLIEPQHFFLSGAIDCCCLLCGTKLLLTAQSWLRKNGRVTATIFDLRFVFIKTKTALRSAPCSLQTSLKLTIDKDSSWVQGLIVQVVSLGIVKFVSQAISVDLSKHVINGIEVVLFWGAYCMSSVFNTSTPILSLIVCVS